MLQEIFSLPHRGVVDDGRSLHCVPVTLALHHADYFALLVSDHLRHILQVGLQQGLLFVQSLDVLLFSILRTDGQTYKQTGMQTNRTNFTEPASEMLSNLILAEVVTGTSFYH